ncbi:hypothetical protein OEZ85_014244 [Tetradesmus obliquus]|uniref:TAFII28-like protein domain-containing protein n=1 Tax=Tetradesmus obliquus TaxID=3088 RepID=A0ABY8UBC7_TETOB|nr:hypothetical protein OEZ85_014244 [Tetradesmus obliquus]
MARNADAAILHSPGKRQAEVEGGDPVGREQGGPARNSAGLTSPAQPWPAPAPQQFGTAWGPSMTRNDALLRSPGMRKPQAGAPSAGPDKGPDSLTSPDKGPAGLNSPDGLSGWLPGRLPSWGPAELQADMAELGGVQMHLLDAAHDAEPVSPASAARLLCQESIDKGGGPAEGMVGQGGVTGGGGAAAAGAGGSMQLQVPPALYAEFVRIVSGLPEYSRAEVLQQVGPHGIASFVHVFYEQTRAAGAAPVQ